MVSTLQHVARESTTGWEAAPPAWTRSLGLGNDGSWQPWKNGAYRLLDSGRYAIASVRTPLVVSLDRQSFQQATTEAYTMIAERLQACRARHPVRFWNLIPGILDPLDDEPHRYMAFNAGRYEAYRQWFESEESFSCEVPTASGVGYPGQDLVVHCLAAETPGEPIENPRQVSSYRYSPQYGSLPPCFARATRINAPLGQADWLLVGGTASVRGEDTVHVDDLLSQCDETFRNLASLLPAAVQTGVLEQEESTLPQLLARYRHLRVYYVRQQDLPVISQQVERLFTGLHSLEYLQAELCRPQLLIEIEGVAELPVSAV